jgi:predicted RNase H-like HicB family nuclease
MTVKPNNELVFEVTQEADGDFVAECMTESIVTQGDTWEELREMVIDAVDAYFFDGRSPRLFACILFAMRSF